MRFLACILVGLMAVTAAQAQPGQETDSSYTFLFVHGAWGGGHDYRQLETILEDKGHEVYRPTMTGQGERVHLIGPDVTLETHIQDILNVIKFEQLSDIVLIGHSYGGMVITGVADRKPELFSHVIYLDAFLPEDGESVFSLNGEESRKNTLKRTKSEGNGYSVPPSWPDPWPDVPHPLGTLQEPVSLENQDQVAEIPATYILTMSPGADSDSFTRFAERAKERDWEFVEMSGGHNVHRDQPEETAKVLLKILQN